MAQTKVTARRGVEPHAPIELWTNTEPSRRLLALPVESALELGFLVAPGTTVTLLVGMQVETFGDRLLAVYTAEYGRIVEQARRYLSRYSYVGCGAEDAVQNAFWRLWRERGTETALLEHAPAAMLVQQILREVRSQAARQKTRDKGDTNLGNELQTVGWPDNPATKHWQTRRMEWETGSTGRTGDRVAPTYTTPPTSAEMDRFIRAARRVVPQRYIKMLMLSVAADLPSRLIAKRFRTSEGAVNQVLYEAKKRLRAHPQLADLLREAVGE